MAQKQIYLGVRELHSRFGAGRRPQAFKTWLLREERAGRFPRRVHLSRRVVAWPADDIERYEQALREARRPKAA
jgi:predicted DNA-binding transcriptional regulator AlpA